MLSKELTPKTQINQNNINFNTLVFTCNSECYAFLALLYSPQLRPASTSAETPVVTTLKPHHDKRNQ